MKALFFENRLSKVIAMRAASLINKEAALGPISPLKYDEIDEPEIPNSRWLKVRNLACGLCGTDLHFMFMDMDPKCFPAAVPGISRKFLGHELVGEVLEVGGSVEDISPGDRVTMRIDWPSCYQMEFDPPCPQCARGNYMLCENQGKRPLPIENPGGGFSPIMVMHHTQAFRIPDELTLEKALLIEPLASAVHGVLKAPLHEGQKALVVGAGTLGLLTLAALRVLAPEVEVHVLARHPFQRKVVRKLGGEAIADHSKSIYARIAKTTGASYTKGYFGNEILLGGFDVVYDTVGNDHSLHHALRWTKGGGRVVLIGINFKPGKIDYSPVWAQEIELVGINCHATEADGRTSFDLAADLLLNDAVNPMDIITHRFPMNRYKDAIRTFTNKKQTGAIKIVLDHPNS